MAQRNSWPLSIHYNLVQAITESANIRAMASDNLFIDHSNRSNTRSESLSEQLAQCSAPYDDPLSAVDWSALDKDAFWLPEEAISLFGTDAYSKLSIGQQRRLSQVEFINFLEAGIWLESLFMERIGRSVREDREHLNDVTYHLHELREEAGHSLMFIELIRRANLHIPTQHFKKAIFANMFARHAPFNGALFWIAVFIGEQVPDKMNRYIRQQRSCVCQIITDIVTIHIQDEARHIAHAKSMISHKLQLSNELVRKILLGLINKMFNDFITAYYFPPNQVYHAAGLEKSINWKSIALNNPHRQAFIEEIVSSTIESISTTGLELRYQFS